MKCAFCCFLSFFLFSASNTHAQLTGSTAETAYTITRMAEIYHVQPRAVDQHFSADLLSQLIHNLDGDKIYFNAADIRQLSAW